jgi:NADH:ubiquinone reductase (H+-translocating)
MSGSAVQVVVLGAGFGGLTFCQAFRHRRAQVTVVDRQNHHLFQPLLYQVAAAGLSAPDIAEPVRSILSRRQDITVLLDQVTDVRLSERVVELSDRRLTYDYLVLALGGVTSYFGHSEWEYLASGLKSLDDALRIRREVLLAFERAETEEDPVRRAQLMTVVVVGGGPTGVELAGAFAELARKVLRRDFRRIDPTQAKVVLLEAGSRVLSHLPERLSESARRQLERLGVEVRTGVRVQDIRPGQMVLEGGAMVAAENILWAAGVCGHPIARRLGVPLDRLDRVRVLPDLSVPGHPEVFVVGDLAHVKGSDGATVPGVSPAAMQMARHVARLVGAELTGDRKEPSARRVFRYRDRGMMATIGRSAAVAKVGPLEFSGLLAWLTWLWVHLIFLIGFDNKLGVLLQWTYSYVTYKRGARIITGETGNRGEAVENDGIRVGVRGSGGSSGG